jgi:hypothetical protein
MASIIAVFFVGVIGAALSQQLADELKAWTPWLVRRIIQFDVALLPQSQRERFSEEWMSHINEVPGEIGKLITALGFLLAVRKMRMIPLKAGRPRLVTLNFDALVSNVTRPVILDGWSNLPHLRCPNCESPNVDYQVGGRQDCRQCGASNYKHIPGSNCWE